MATGTIPRSPLAFGFGQMRLLPSEANGGDLNTLTENGIYSWGPGGKPANAPWNRGVVLQERISNDSSASESFQIAASSKQNAKEIKVRWRYSNNPTWDAWEILHGAENYSQTDIGITGIQSAKVINGIAFLRFYDFKPTSASYTLGTLPAGLKPSVNSYGVLMSADGTNSIRAEVQTTGSVSIVHGDTGKYHYGTVVYPVV